MLCWWTSTSIAERKTSQRVRLKRPLPLSDGLQHPWSRVLVKKLEVTLFTNFGQLRQLSGRPVQLTTAQPPLCHDLQELPQNPQPCQSVIFIESHREPFRCNHCRFVHQEVDERRKVVEINGPCFHREEFDCTGYGGEDVNERRCGRRIAILRCIG